jgi:hypothetical protein
MQFRIRYILLSVTFVLLLAGCASTATVGVPADYAGPVATLKGNRAGIVAFFASKEAHCMLLALDGKGGNAFRVLPGEHRVRFYVSNMGQEFVGNVQVTLPEPKDYQVRAWREHSTFTVSLFESGSTNEVGAFVIPVNQHMPLLIMVPK